ncbi:MAG: response regulator transcription factor [Chloroflexi bacterium]|nr:response regulator transcription factor [Chloroflexota bacterium]
MKKIRVLLVDDHDIVRLGLMTLLNDQPDMEVVGEASASMPAIQASERFQPDVVLMDIRLPGEGGIEATRQITSRFAHIKVVMLTSFADDDLVIRAINAGATGYVLKQVGNEELIRAIRATARGESLLDSSTTARLLAHVRKTDRLAQEDAFRDFTDREMDVLLYLAKGKTNSEIASLLHLSEKTVGNYVANMFMKLQVNNRVELAAYAYEHHLFEKIGKE